MAGFTPLHLAVHAGALEAAAALVRGGATLTGRTVHDSEGPNCALGTTPLHLAAQRGDRDMILLLLTAWVSTWVPAGCAMGVCGTEGVGECLLAAQCMPGLLVIWL
jgi:hypothetical protein